MSDKELSDTHVLQAWFLAQSEEDKAVLRDMSNRIRKKVNSRKDLSTSQALGEGMALEVLYKLGRFRQNR